MRKMLAVGMVAMLTNIGTANADWVQVAPESDPTSDYVDTESVKVVGTLISASTLTNNVYYPPFKNPSAIGTILVNCHDGTVHNKRTTAYTQPMGLGDAIKTIEMDQAIKVGARSATFSEREQKNIEAIYSFICRPMTPPSGRELAARVGPIPFAAGTSNLSQEAKAGLDKFIAWLKANPDRKARLEGHSDESGSAEYDLALGDKLAHSVKAYMVAGGIDASRLTTVSYGRFRPLPSGGRNSRVEMVFDE